MVRVYFEYHNPVCDCCGHTLGAERDDEAAEAAMEADGWHKVEGKDLCRLCWRHYEETGRMPRKLIFYKEETNMEEVSNKKDLEEIEAAEGCADACPVEGVAESSTTAEVTTSLSQDMIHAVANEVRRREDATYHSAYESYAILSAELEIKAAVEKDLKKSHVGAVGRREGRGRRRGICLSPEHRPRGQGERHGLGAGRCHRGEGG